MSIKNVIDILLLKVLHEHIYFPAHINMMQKYEKLNDQVIQCPKHFVDMAAHIDSNPDPYFDSSYNWYYAGNGNLQVICIDWVDYLLHSEFSNVCKYLLFSLFQYMS